MEVKKCKKCENEFPATKEFFYKDRSRLMSRCKNSFWAIIIVAYLLFMALIVFNN